MDARGFPVAVYVPHTVAASRRHVTRWAGRKLVQTWHGWWIMHGFDTESLRRLGCLGTQLWETWSVIVFYVWFVLGGGRTEGQFGVRKTKMMRRR